MLVPRHEKDIAVFSAESVRAMSPCGQGLAKILADSGWITIVNEDLPGQPVGGQTNENTYTVKG